MAQLIFNAIWLAVAVAAFLVAPRRSGRASFALVCVIALLFPIISISDDFMDRDVMDDVLAIVVAPIVIITALIALAVVEIERRSRTSLLVATLSDPRSPPRA